MTTPPPAASPAPLRVLHVDTSSEWRGGQNQIVLTALGQSKRGHAPVILARPDSELSRRAKARGAVVRDAGLGRGDLSIRTCFAVRAAVARLRPDVVHVHESHGLVAALLSKALLRPPPRLVASRRVDFALNAFSKSKYARFDAVLAVSDAVRDVLVRGGLDAGRVRLVHEGVADRPASPGGRDALFGLGVPKDAPVIGNVAQLVDHKDHATLLRAFWRATKDRPDAWLVICGSGPLERELRALAVALGVAEKTVFAGFRSDLDALLPVFDIFTLTSHLEGLGTSLLDAMCFARPVVATSAGGIKDAVEDGVTGLLAPPRDPEALGQAFVDLLADPALSARMGRAGRSRFLERFTDDAMVASTLRAYGPA